MQTMTRAAIRLAHFMGNLLLLELALLVIVALLWRLTAWHTTASLGGALSTVGGILIVLGLMSVITGGSAEDVKLMDAEMEMRSWDHKGQRRFTSPYAERTRTMGWLLSLGLTTVGVGIIFNVFLP